MTKNRRYSVNKALINTLTNKKEKLSYLTEERDACGVGFIADIYNQASHKIVMKGIEALTCMEHRGACGADKDSGDGSGLTTGLPIKFFESYFKEKKWDIEKDRIIGVGMCFLPSHSTTKIKDLIKEVVIKEKFNFLGWRIVPTNPNVLGIQAKNNKPVIAQFFIDTPNTDNDAFERSLYLTRKKIEKTVSQIFTEESKDLYICSLSCRTIIYKGMVRSSVLGQFYQDLYHPLYESSFALYHRRFSTNTMPKWPLAQPMRFVAHNGEINTLLGNLNWMRTREPFLEHPYWKNSIKDLQPITNPANSDSANLDATVELLINTGRSPEETLMIVVPEAYENQPELNKYPEVTQFYEYYSHIVEAWDGPALVTFTDGKTIGATLDRNGLRPARYCITNDNLIIVASESGAMNVKTENISKKGRLGPGQMIIADLEEKSVLQNWEIKSKIAKKLPYGNLLKDYRNLLQENSFLNKEAMSDEKLFIWQSAFGYSTEDVELVIENMASQGKEPTFCMGDDIPLAVLSENHHLLYDYFKQRFAQVTNPAIDPLREKLVMSLSMEIGPKTNLLEPGKEQKHTIKLPSPFINEKDLETIENSILKTKRFYPVLQLDKNDSTLSGCLSSNCLEIANEVKQGLEIIIISDKLDTLEINEVPIPPLLMIGALHHYLIKQHLRQNVSIILETAQCWNTHHFACLIGYGASAICPYLALETTRKWWHSPKTQNFIERGKLENLSILDVQKNYKQAIELGLLKILSKMGISLLSSYQGAQIFEILGLGHEVIETAFCGTASQIGGLNLKEIEKEIVMSYSKAFSQSNKNKLINYGFVQYRPSGEYHINNPQMSKLLHKAVRGYKTEYYTTYKQVLQERPLTSLRDLLEFKTKKSSMNINEVESIESIMARFCTGGMSLGALSRETHETLAIAMNRIGGKSNSGEGGEDKSRFIPLSDVNKAGQSDTFPHLKGLSNGDRLNSAIKQIASGRFGVTPEYLVNAEQLEIKIAQGAKPGEGGQLPGKKVSPYIASLRGCKTGVTLISPPPHHDIYSIEDLSQLIFDLHQINPESKVSVKLVAEIGIGTIAAGVAKGNADIIQISGHEGGTGASPLSSIKHAGSPWELGLSEVQQTLVNNNLRDRVLLRVDGGLRTGKDIVMAAMMGAEEFGFGTVAMIATGCIMARICHTNSCPVGVATQREDLRARFPGVAENLVYFFMFIAEEIRETLSELGYQSIDEIIGKTDLLSIKKSININKTKELDLNILLKQYNKKVYKSASKTSAHSNGTVIDDDILGLQEVQEAIKNHSDVSKKLKISTINRTVGSRISGTIAKQYGNKGFGGNLNLDFYGSAGQSFGAFIIDGMKLKLVGEANDYVGKGMNGGEIIIVPSQYSQFEAANQSIVGNTCLYGATGGYLFINGCAGERFAVRNSQAISIVEGVGDHACEYMTGGIVIILGKTGRNIGAGMTGGLAYILDTNNDLVDKVNNEIVKVQKVVSKQGQTTLKNLLEEHIRKTSSQKAKSILKDWNNQVENFLQLVPPSEQNNPNACINYEENRLIKS
uniref:ferredoxin-dependent glutamate synthase n=1 Tax=Pseudoerythrocladia kornmannii TaxID=753682 RepID=UPI001BEFA8ED|nr:ferredoxin-dependent glutamate synthase [Pseudoerythrocladia kornmannii]QUE28205.1 GltB [Pseudoerythrocladia kornmannii]UNJ16710.1 ferredoxin-dependent glutamate synthase [Pseudoerythrocladia kornmannii]